MFMKSGQIILNKTDRKALIVIMKHTEKDLEYGEGGTYNKDNGKDFVFDEAEAKRARLGLDTIEGILYFTK